MTRGPLTDLLGQGWGGGGHCTYREHDVMNTCFTEILTISWALTLKMLDLFYFNFSVNQIVCKYRNKIDKKQVNRIIYMERLSSRK